MEKSGVIVLIILLVSIISFANTGSSINVVNRITGKVTENVTVEPECSSIAISMWCLDETTLCPMTTDEQGCSVWDCDSCEITPDEEPGGELVCCETWPVIADPNPPRSYSWTSEDECPPLHDGMPPVGQGYNVVDNSFCEEEPEPPLEPHENGGGGSEPEEPPYEVETCAAKIKITLDKDVYYYGDYVKVRVEISDAEGNGLTNYPFRSRIFTYGDGLWHTGESSETDENGIFINNDGRIEKGKQPPGKIKLKVTTAPNIIGCGPVEDIVELEVREGEDTEEVCGIGVCVPEEEEVEDIPEDRGLYACSGCELEGKCYPMGYRKAGQYCSENYEFVEQLDEVACDNSFECKSNICVSGECVGEGLIRKIIKWFKRMFGGDEDEPKPEVDCSELLIEKDIGDYEYSQSGYGDSKESQAPLYSEDGESIGTVRCCSSQYLEQGKRGRIAIVCPFDNREDTYNTIKWLLARREITPGDYKDQQVYKDRVGSFAIIWTHKNFIIAVGGAEPERNVPLPEDIADAYIDKFPSDMEDIEVPPELSHDPAKEFLDEAEKLGTVELIDFETLPDGTVLQNEDRLTGKEWESLGVTFEAPSEDYLQVFGPMYPFNPLDKLSLSPGLGPFVSGSDTHDDLNIIFTEPVKAAGIYLLDLGETDERESITFLDKDGNIIKEISPWPKSMFGNPAPGTFVSLISNEGIARIEILENPNDQDDIAYDNLYFVK